MYHNVSLQQPCKHLHRIKVKYPFNIVPVLNVAVIVTLIVKKIHYLFTETRNVFLRLHNIYFSVL